MALSRLLGPGRNLRLPGGQAAVARRWRAEARLPLFRRGGRRGTTTPAGSPAGCWGWELDQACLQREAGQVGPAPASGLVPDPVQVGADGADADVQLGGDLGVSAAPGDQGDQLLFPRTEPAQR